MGLSLTKAKQNVVDKKMEMQMDRVNIERHDIVGIVHYAWEQSFARVETNKKATAARGWNPLTYNLLDNKDLKREKASNPVKAAYEMCMISGKAAADPLTLNFNEGYSATLMDKVVSYKVRQQALDTARTENAAETARQRKEKFQRCSTMTAGICFNSGNLCISDETVRDRVREETQKKKEKELAAELRKKDAEAAIFNKVQAIRQKNLLPMQWDRKDLGTMVSWFKRPGDKALPGNKEMLLRRYYRTCHRCEKERSRLKEGEQPVTNDDADDDDDPPLPGSSGESGDNNDNLALCSGSGTENDPTFDLGSGRVNGNSPLGGLNNSDATSVASSSTEVLLQAAPLQLASGGINGSDSSILPMDVLLSAVVEMV